jgi:short-chain fatty acids transporter
LVVAAVYVVVGPLLFYLLAPKETIDLPDLLEDKGGKELSIEAEAAAARLPQPALSDKLNNGWFFQYVIASLGLFYIAYYFWTRGLDLNLNIMIFIFLILGLFLHKTPMRYGIAMKHASANISGILFQYPFYAAIMGIMIYTGLGERLASVMASVATIDTYPFFAYLTGGLVNFAIPSAGGEFAVIGPSVLTAIKEIGTGLPSDQLNLMMAKASLAVAYGETLTNLLQPFFLLIVLPVMGKGIKVQARDVMGYLIIPFIVVFTILAVVVGLVPV